MAMIAKGGTSGAMGPDGKPRGPFVVSPAGPQQAVCCDVIDLGVETNKFNGKSQHKIRLRWLSEHTMPDGRPFMVQKKYTFSLNAKATLSKDLESWRGAPFTDAERAAGFDLERLIGKNCYLNVMHGHRAGNTYADVMTVMRCPKDRPVLAVPPDYVRHKDKAPDPAATAGRQPGDEDDAAVGFDSPDTFDQRRPEQEDDPFSTDVEF